MDLTNEGGSEAADGSYYIRFASGWSPQQANVEAGLTEIPLWRIGRENIR